MRAIIYILLILSSLSLTAQVKPNDFPEEMSPNNDNFELYSQKNGINKKTSLDAMKAYIINGISGGSGSAGQQGPKGDKGDKGDDGIGIAQNLQNGGRLNDSIQVVNISGGTGVSFNIADKDNDPYGELQEFEIAANGDWSLSEGGGSGSLSELFRFSDDTLFMNGDTILFDKYINDVPDSMYQYTIVDGTTTVEIWATGDSVTISENQSGGELTITIPDDVELNKVNVKLTATSVDNDNNYFVLFDYEGLRTYNTEMSNLNLPSVLVSSAETASMSRNSPVLYSADGNAGVDVGISAFSGGDGSDLEISVIDFLLASNQFITFKF